MVWKPHVTVAAIIERGQRFLLVEEETSDGIRLNQPAGHLEEGEDLLTAARREVLEETAWHFEPEHIVAIQLWRRNPESPSFLRICFSGNCHSHEPETTLDTGIIATHWLTREEILSDPKRLRSPLVALCIDEYLKGTRYPLSLIKSLLDLNHG
ncbi:NUDIX hydrolase [Methylomicrobium sp. Wu6]|uniref:NUDIX hydrolase n=1 Tax=Methylomicrobium sp. Wu6 TaxID=3107928 RepID=UPI002DD6A929|nr:NUDIX hydrolase [Methylomicrobium sp. Wu6]MEC4750350.1 NUDIX hydrolase [Methylomicrobium sp. Wu6]